MSTSKTGLQKSDILSVLQRKLRAKHELKCKANDEINKNTEDLLCLTNPHKHKFQEFKCCVAGCLSSSLSCESAEAIGSVLLGDKTSIKLFKFPSDVELLEKWKKVLPAIGAVNLDSCICQKHFSELPVPSFDLTDDCNEVNSVCIDTVGKMKSPIMRNILLGKHSPLKRSASSDELNCDRHVEKVLVLSKTAESEGGNVRCIVVASDSSSCVIPVTFFKFPTGRKHVSGKICEVGGCHNYNNAEAKFYKFPSEQSVLSQWEKFVQQTRLNFVLDQSQQFICAAHFLTASFLQECKLKPDAVPVIPFQDRTHYNMEILEDSSSKAMEKLRSPLVSAKKTAVKVAGASHSVVGKVCQVGACSNIHSHNATLHPLPTNPKLKKLWMRFIESTRSDYLVARNSHSICNGHFACPESTLLDDVGYSPSVVPCIPCQDERAVQFKTRLAVKTSSLDEMLTPMAGDQLPWHKFSCATVHRSNRLCQVGGCKNQSNAKATFFSFPSEADQLKVWEDFVRETRSDEFKVKLDEHLICSAHFGYQSFNFGHHTKSKLCSFSSNHLKLKPKSYPTIPYQIFEMGMKRTGAEACRKSPVKHPMGAKKKLKQYLDSRSQGTIYEIMDRSKKKSLVRVLSEDLPVQHSDGQIHLTSGTVCEVGGCRNASQRGNTRFFLFPKPGDQCVKWEEFVQKTRMNFNAVPGVSKICRSHFRKKDLTKNKNLKENVVPTIYNQLELSKCAAVKNVLSDSQSGIKSVVQLVSPRDAGDGKSKSQTNSAGLADSAATTLPCSDALSVQSKATIKKVSSHRTSIPAIQSINTNSCLLKGEPTAVVDEAIPHDTSISEQEVPCTVATASSKSKNQIKSKIISDQVAHGAVVAGAASDLTRCNDRRSSELGVVSEIVASAAAGKTADEPGSKKIICIPKIQIHSPTSTMCCGSSILASSSRKQRKTKRIGLIGKKPFSRSADSAEDEDDGFGLVIDSASEGNKKVKRRDRMVSSYVKTGPAISDHVKEALRRRLTHSASLDSASNTSSSSSLSYRNASGSGSPHSSSSFSSPSSLLLDNAQFPSSKDSSSNQARKAAAFYLIHSSPSQKFKIKDKTPSCGAPSSTVSLSKGLKIKLKDASLCVKANQMQKGCKVKAKMFDKSCGNFSVLSVCPTQEANGSSLLVDHPAQMPVSSDCSPQGLKEPLQKISEMEEVNNFLSTMEPVEYDSSCPSLETLSPSVAESFSGAEISSEVANSAEEIKQNQLLFHQEKVKLMQEKRRENKIKKQIQENIRDLEKMSVLPASSGNMKEEDCLGSIKPEDVSSNNDVSVPLYGSTKLQAGKFSPDKRKDLQYKGSNNNVIETDEMMKDDDVKFINMSKQELEHGHPQCEINGDKSELLQLSQPDEKSINFVSKHQLLLDSEISLKDQPCLSPKSGMKNNLNLMKNDTLAKKASDVPFCTENYPFSELLGLEDLVTQESTLFTSESVPINFMRQVEFCMDQTFTCKICRSRFTALTEAFCHLAIVHAINKFQCGNCHHGFASDLLRELHTITIHSLELQCLHCMWHFVLPANHSELYVDGVIAEHLSKCHPSDWQNRQTFACEHCGQSYSNVCMFWHHQRTNHCLEKFSCTSCKPTVHLADCDTFLMHLIRCHCQTKRVFDKSKAKHYAN